MTEKQLAKAKKYFDRGEKIPAIATILGLPEENIIAALEPKPKTPAQQKETIQKVEEKVAKAKSTTKPPVQTTTKTEGYNVTTGLHTKTTKKVGFGKK